LAQRALQQSALAAQLWPSGLQEPPPQAPLVQCPLQHSAAAAQAWLSGLQLPPPHLPLVQWPVQQSEAAAQLCPSALQVPLPQTWLVQTPVQQSLAAAQAWPSGVQSCTQLPLWQEDPLGQTPQVPPQPSGPHCLSPQVWLQQLPLTQRWPVVQAGTQSWHWPCAVQ
jgi:hypothetical protein